MRSNASDTQRELVRNALRMRPDRIILGEVRGDEAFEMIQAMNTGHSGSLCTLHANSATDALVRMENMLMMSQATLPLFSLRRQIADTIDVVMQVEECAMEKDALFRSPSARVRRRTIHHSRFVRLQAFIGRSTRQPDWRI